MSYSRNPALVGLAALLFVGSAQAQDDRRIVDLTHTYDEETIYWPTSPTDFGKETLAEGETDGGWFYSAYSVSTPEHGGTHLDAPYHFFENGLKSDEIPLDDLIGPAVVIDVSAKAAVDGDYRLSVDDIAEFEAEHGRIPDGSIVLLRTDWSHRWPDTLAYLGDDTPGDASNLSFPSFGVEAARFLVQQRAAVVLGVDTASIDYGPSTDFAVHRAVAAENVVGLENLTNLDQLPPKGATVIALPMKVGGGSGGPVRVVALIPAR